MYLVLHVSSFFWEKRLPRYPVHNAHALHLKNPHMLPRHRNSDLHSNKKTQNWCIRYEALDWRLANHSHHIHITWSVDATATHWEHAIAVARTHSLLFSFISHLIRHSLGAEALHQSRAASRSQQLQMNYRERSTLTRDSVIFQTHRSRSVDDWVWFNTEYKW